MSATTVAVLTPPGSSAVAVLSVRGPVAWPVIQRYFRTALGKPLTEKLTGFVFGRIGELSADEVILAAVRPDTFEVHCHGGQRVVAWLLELLRAHGIVEEDAPPKNGSRSAEAARLLPFARTVRTAAILLDQSHGAYDRAEHAIRQGGPNAETLRAALRQHATVGRHLVEPWTVAIAGPPNAGKSSLLNALAGFARSVVSPISGTTRDAVSVSLAFDGWPVELTDTAGFRESADPLESEGVGRARTAAAASDLVLWVVDVTGRLPQSPAEVVAVLGTPPDRVVVVLNKTDLAHATDSGAAHAIRVSARTGAGLDELVARIVRKLVPNPPGPGEPVPFTPEMCDRWSGL